MKKLEQQGSMDRRIETVLNKFRSRMNAYPPGMCPLALYRSLLQISINQSCGKCVPCRDGLPKAEKLLKDILDGNGSFDSCKKLEDLCLMISKTSDCAVGVVAARMILDSLIEFPDEYQSHIEKKLLCGKRRPDDPLQYAMPGPCQYTGIHCADQRRRF